MKFILFISCFILTIQAAAQKTETYYDYNWKPCESINARFYSTLEKTDSGWLRYDYFLSGPKLQMKALFEDSACKVYNGQSTFLYANGNIASTGRRVHNKHEGVCLSFYSNGMMSDSADYYKGEPVGNKMEWWPNGVVADSVTHVNDSLDIEVSWFDNGTPSQAGYLLNGKMTGKWKFFHNNGQTAAIETYERDKLLTREFFKEDGSPQKDTSKGNHGASFRGGLDAWQTYLSSKLYWPPNYQFSNGDMAVVVVDITINEDGKPENVEVATPFHPAFDKIALDVIRRCPAWNPAVQHNRRVKDTFRQPVTFRQEEQ